MTDEIHDNTPTDEPVMEQPPADEAAPADENKDLFRPLTFFLLIALGLLALYMYQYPLHRTYLSWGSEHHYNDNGPYIFGGALLLVYWMRRQLRAIPKAINYWGLAFATLALLWSVAFKRGDINAMQTFGFIALVWTLCLYLGGWALARALVFPCFLSLFAVQWGLASSVISLRMRLMSTEFACWFINVTGKVIGVEVLRQGTNVSMVDMPDLAFDVAAACSGLQSLLMTTVLSLLMCYLVLRTWWKRLVMIVLIAPIAILNNALRIVLIAWTGKFFTWIEHLLHLSHGWGKAVAFGAFHEYPGIFVYSMGFLLVWLTAHYLERLPGAERADWLRRKAEKKARKQARLAEAAAPDAPAEEERGEEAPAAEEVPAPDYTFYGTLWKHVLIALLLVFLGFRVGLLAKQNITATTALASERVPTWVVGKTGYDQRTLPYITALPPQLADYLRIDLPVSEEELKQLPNDTEYFRGLYVPTNMFERCAEAAKIMLMTHATNGAMPAVDKVMRLMFGADAPDTNDLERLERVIESLRATIANDRNMLGPAYSLVLIQLAQQVRSASNIMLAIVQNNTDQHSIHPPEACFPAQGWSIDDVIPAQIVLGGRTADVARLDVGFRQQGVRECVLYWYQSAGTQGTRLYATRNYPWLPFKTALDLILRGRSTRWAFVRLSASVPDGATYDEAFGRLTRFIKDAEPYLLYPE